MTGFLFWHVSPAGYPTGPGWVWGTHNRIQRRLSRVSRTATQLSVIPGAFFGGGAWNGWSSFLPGRRLARPQSAGFPAGFLSVFLAGFLDFSSADFLSCFPADFPAGFLDFSSVLSSVLPPRLLECRGSGRRTVIIRHNSELVTDGVSKVWMFAVIVRVCLVFQEIPVWQSPSGGF